MKRLLVAIITSVICIGITAQAPQGFNYQAILRNPDGTNKANEPVALQISIIDEAGASAYLEVHNVTTNEFGLVNVVVGQGSTSGDFSMISWAAGPYFIDITVNGENLGSSPLLSVPYALYAESGNEGPQGPPGMQGIQGEMGPTGPNGDTGDSGPQGIPGTKGEQGDPGDLGPKGDQGEIGVQGEQGLQGLPGIKGDQGEVGPAGIQGLPGPQGEKGDKGDVGLQGDTGDPGPQGEPGDTKWVETPDGISYDGGFVGIGTTNPTTKLNIVDDVASGKGRALIRLRNINEGNLATTGITLESFDGLYGTSLSQTSENYTGMPGTERTGVLSSAGNGLLLYTYTDYGSIRFSTGKDALSITERMRITSKGNVGIGTISPTAKLEVSGTVKANQFVGDGSDLSGIMITESQISDLAHFTGADITGGETAFEGWDKNESDDFSGNMSNERITNLANPTYAQDAATKSYVDAILEEISNKLLELGLTGFVVDIDGNIYNTVKIGDQVWMAENLKVTNYFDGTTLPLVESGTAWVALGLTDKAYCWFDNNSSNGDTYGALYTWAAAMNGAGTIDTNPSGVQGVCPDGWHLPSDGEWTELKNYLTNNGHSSTEGTALKTTSGWDSGGNGTDDYGFSGLPGGYRHFDGNFFGLNLYGNWWSTTESSSSNAWYVHLGYNNSDFARNERNKQRGFSVRCVKD